MRDALVLFLLGLGLIALAWQSISISLYSTCDLYNEEDDDALTSNISSSSSFTFDTLSPLDDLSSSPPSSFARSPASAVKQASSPSSLPSPSSTSSPSAVGRRPPAKDKLVPQYNGPIALPSGQPPPEGKHIARMLKRVYISVVTSVQFSSDMWGHWLAHYTDASLGLDKVPKSNYIVILHSTRARAGRELDQAKALFQAHGITPIVWRDTFTTLQKRIFKNAVFAERVPSNAWLIETDDDELIEFPKPVPEFLAEVGALGYNVVSGDMVDHIAEDCRLPQVLPNMSLWQQYPCIGDVTKGILKATTHKKTIHKGNLFTGGGQHEIMDYAVRGKMYKTKYKESPEKLRLHHFKWRAGCLEKLKERAKRFKEKGIWWWIESDTFLKFYEKHGKIAVPECGCGD